MIIDTKEMVSVMLTQIEIADIDVRGFNLRISDHADHRFRLKPTSRFGDADQLFR